MELEKLAEQLTSKWVGVKIQRGEINRDELVAATKMRKAKDITAGKERAKKTKAKLKKQENK